MRVTVLLLPALLVSMDLSILFVAAPSISAALTPTGTEWLWMMDVYGFVMAGLLITMGSLGDRIGRRRLLLIGAALFGAASALLTLATEPWTFVLARALLGIGGATLAPSTLSLIRGLYPDEHRRRRAVGAWTVAFTGGSVAGPVIGGVLLEHFWWGSLFLINIPVMLLLLVTAPFLLGESKSPHRARFDLPGAALSLPAVLGPVLAMKHAASHGPDARAVTAAAVGAAFAAAFVVRQRRAAHPLIDVRLFRARAFSAAIAANTAIALAASGVGVLAFTFMQAVHGLSALHAALAALPTFAGTIAGATLAGALAPRVRPALLLASGLALVAAGFAVIAQIRADTSLWAFIAGYAILTVGAGVTGTLANGLILGTAPPERAGAAAGVSETGTELGAALGIAVLGTAATTVYRIAMEDTAATGPATETIAAALAEPGLADAATAAYTSGVTTAAGISAAVLLPVIALVAWALRGTRPS
ncbi:MFS transporter [Actinomadura sp. WMMB 499]|uniref:MFS transporter n=1 Tax=Actinomadura sp. WMMB 499 TaxID=1219491 RepID=UPI001244C14F|nr:MFS transporter [Actinomadura sp. WMMB 499]QFG23108.1 MFS transporter [Actinomadura sp. WMMB 499]